MAKVGRKDSVSLKNSQNDNEEAKPICFQRVKENDMVSIKRIKKP